LDIGNLRRDVSSKYRWRPKTRAAWAILASWSLDAYISLEGKFAGDADMKADSTIKARVFLSGIMVDAAPNARAVVTFGDSITDGADSTPDANHRWPDVLARRLFQAGGAPLAVLNEGISGARVLSDRMGVNALARFDRDVLSHLHA
jgi:hypothetical protein